MKLVYTYPGAITRKGVEFAHGVPTEVPGDWAPGDERWLRAQGCVDADTVPKPKAKAKVIVDDGDPVPPKPKRGVKRKRTFGG